MKEEIIMKRIIINADPGIDDAIAIIMALKHPDIKVEAITAVSGNMTADVSCNNALKVLEFMGAGHIPVAEGMMHPLVRPFPKDPYSHGDDGLGNHFFPEPALTKADIFAPDMIIDLVNRYPGEITIAALGPLTNLALAIMKDPDITGKIKEVFCTGGAFGFNEYAYRNATGDNPASEWNIYVDPEAARLVFESDINLTAVGLDIAYHPDVNFLEEDYREMERIQTSEAKFVLDICNFCRERTFDSSSGVIDGITMAALIEPGILTVQNISVGVECTSPLTLGRQFGIGGIISADRIFRKSMRLPPLIPDGQYGL